MPDDPILMNVEDDTPEVPEVPTAPPVVAAPAEPPAPDPLPEEPETLSPADLVDQDKAKSLIGAVIALRKENKAFKEKAQQHDTLSQRLAQLEGQVQGYQQVAQQLRQPPAAPIEPTTDPRALAFAQKLDLYTQDANGQAVPDIAKAAAILGIVEEVADQKTNSRLAPMLQRTARERAVANYQWALGVKDPVTQQPIPKPLIDEVFKMMGVEAAANPEIAKTLLFAAAGMERMTKAPQPAAPVTTPVVTEGVGGNPRTRPVLSQLEQNVAKERGIDPAKWADSTKNFQSGRTVTLED